jgi:hypothetical protein
VLPLLVALAQPVVPAPPESQDPLELELVWHAPAECPSAAAIEARIRALLPGDPAGEGVLAVQGDVTTTPEGVLLVLVSTFRGQSEHRELRARDCAELGEATAVLIAVALEPARAQAIRESTGAKPAEPAAPADAPRTGAFETPIAGDLDATKTDVARESDAAPVPRRRARGPFGWALRLAGGLEAGAVPPPTGAVQAAAILEWPRARLEVHGVWLVPRTKLDGQGRGATYQLGAAGVRGCGRLFARAVEFPLCLGAEAGVVRARTQGLVPSKVEHGPWVGALASVGVARAWGPVGVWSAAEALGRVVGSEFKIGEVRALGQFPVSVRLLVGIEVRGSWIRRAGGQ